LGEDSTLDKGECMLSATPEDTNHDTKLPKYAEFHLSEYARSTNLWYHEERRLGTQFDFLAPHDRARQRANAGKFLAEFGLGLILGFMNSKKR
jgi:hypothetical protein